MIRIFLADDHRLVREGVRRLLESESNLKVVGEAEDGEQALALIKTLRPDVVLLDFSMPKMDGMEVLEEMTKWPDAPPVIMLSMHSSTELVRRAMQAGAKAFVAKGSSSELLTKTVRTVLQESD